MSDRKSSKEICCAFHIILHRPGEETELKSICKLFMHTKIEKSDEMGKIMMTTIMRHIIAIFINAKNRYFLCIKGSNLAEKD
uniref:Uncharacterized protein n=1 Tax=Onchocerca volvulus TaxID=6282 RepID=A0A8R1XYJ3_ONCVO